MKQYRADLWSSIEQLCKNARSCHRRTSQERTPREASKAPIEELYEALKQQFCRKAPKRSLFPKHLGGFVKHSRSFLGNHPSKELYDSHTATDTLALLFMLTQTHRHLYWHSKGYPPTDNNNDSHLHCHVHSYMNDILRLTMTLTPILTHTHSHTDKHMLILIHTYNNSNSQWHLFMNTDLLWHSHQSLIWINTHTDTCILTNSNSNTQPCTQSDTLTHL